MKPQRSRRATSRLRNAAAVGLALLAFAALLWTAVAWDGMRTEDALHHEVGNDTALFAAAALIGATTTVLLVAAAAAVWKWPEFKRRRSQERDLLRASRRGGHDAPPDAPSQ